MSSELREYLGDRGMAHTRGRPYPPQTQSKIERYRRTMKNVVKLQHDFFPWELEAALRDFVAYYNNECDHDLRRSDSLRICSGFVTWTSKPAALSRST